MRADATGTIAVLGTARRAEWWELRRLLGRDRTVLREAEREWVIEVDVDVCDSLRADWVGDLGSLVGEWSFILDATSDGDIDMELHLLTSVMTGSQVFVEMARVG